MESEIQHIRLPDRLILGNHAEIQKLLDGIDPDRPVTLDFSGVDQIDSTGIAMIGLLRKNQSALRVVGLSEHHRRLIDVFSDKGSSAAHAREGSTSIPARSRWENLKLFLVLLADELANVGGYVWHRRGIYPGEIRQQLYLIGYGSVFIVSVITFLVGVTIALTSAEQLNNFGANIYLADLVGFGMVRELVPLMAGIILAGKVGASITAEISSMKVLEEVDALQTMGLNPEKFLMVPRLIAISLAVPLLFTLANIIGIFGGMLVGKFFSGITFSAFYQEMLTIIDLSDFLFGLGKTMVFGWVIVISSGFKGFSVTRGALGVGIATTESVVLSISLIIVLDSFFALLAY